MQTLLVDLRKLTRVRDYHLYCNKLKWLVPLLMSRTFLR